MDRVRLHTSDLWLTVMVMDLSLVVLALTRLTAVGGPGGVVGFIVP